MTSTFDYVKVIQKITRELDNMNIEYKTEYNDNNTEFIFSDGRKIIASPTQIKFIGNNIHYTIVRPLSDKILEIGNYYNIPTLKIGDDELSRLITEPREIKDFFTMDNIKWPTGYPLILREFNKEMNTNKSGTVEEKDDNIIVYTKNTKIIVTPKGIFEVSPRFDECATLPDPREVITTLFVLPIEMQPVSGAIMPDKNIFIAKYKLRKEIVNLYVTSMPWYLPEIFQISRELMNEKDVYNEFFVIL